MNSSFSSTVRLFGHRRVDLELLRNFVPIILVFAFLDGGRLVLNIRGIGSPTIVKQSFARHDKISIFILLIINAPCKKY